MRLFGGLDLPPKPFHGPVQRSPPGGSPVEWRGYCTISESRADLVSLSLNYREDM